MRFGIAKFAAILLFVSLAFTAGLQETYAQARPSSKTSVLSLDVLGLAVGRPLTVGYEWKSSPVNSWQLRGYFWPVNSDYSAFGIGGDYRFYIADSRALTGLSVAPAADLFFFNSSALSKTFTSFDVGGDLAYKWIFDQFAVEPLLGLRIGFAGNEGVSASTGFGAVIGVALGYAW